MYPHIFSSHLSGLYLVPMKCTDTKSYLLVLADRFLIGQSSKTESQKVHFHTAQSKQTATEKG